MSFTHLNQALRYQIEKQLAEGKSAALIARRLGIHRSTVYREKARGLVKGHYCGATSHQRTLKRRSISAANHRTHAKTLWRTVCVLLRKQWSPEQISGRLKLTECVGGLSVSAQTIYNWLHRTDSVLSQHLRHYRSSSQWRQGGCGMPKGRPSIRKRPKEVLKREQAGHWEGDTIAGRSKRICIITLLERKSLFVKISSPLPKQSEGVAKRIKRTFSQLDAKTLTLDNGTEFAQFPNMGLPVYFADPGRPRQRSRNENANGLIRQYIPKGANLSRFSSSQIKRIEDKLNDRPRKTLGYKTPREVLFDLTPTPVAIRP